MCHANKGEAEAGKQYKERYNYGYIVGEKLKKIIHIKLYVLLFLSFC